MRHAINGRPTAVLCAAAVKRSVLTVAMAALLAGPFAHANTVVTTVTTFEHGTDGCAGTELLFVLEGTPLEQPRCQPQLPGYPGSASHAESADASGNMSFSDSAAFGTPVLRETADFSKPEVVARMTLTGPARSVDVEASFDVDPLTSSPVDFVHSQLGDYSASVVVVRGDAERCTDGSQGNGIASSVEAFALKSENGSAQPGGHFVYTTHLSCLSGSTLEGRIDAASYMVGDAFSGSTATVTAEGSAHLRSVTFTVDYQ